MTKPIIGKLLFHFPPEWPAAYQIHEGDGHFVWLSDPSGNSVAISRMKLLAVLGKIFDEEFRKVK